MLIGSIAEMAHPLDIAKHTAGPIPRTMDHDFFSMP
jgi:hypothetical protein